MKIRIKVFTVLFLLMGLFLTGCNPQNLQGSIQDGIITSDDVLKIHYIDVGQGDATFIELPNQEVMLIDAGEKEYGDVVSSYIKKLGYTKIDYLVGTHPHTDHIGGLKKIVTTFDIGKVYMPRATSTSSTYRSLLDAIDDKNLKIQTAKAGVTVYDDASLKMEFLAPNQEKYANLNNYSAVLKICYGKRSFLFMGDAEVLSEEEIEGNVQADVLKVGHHGSDSSSSSKFIQKVNAKYGIISVGKDNVYNHPSNMIVNRLEDSGMKIYRTDEEGTIVLKSDGTKIQIQNEEVESPSDKTDETPQEDISLISLTNPIKRGNLATIEVQGKANSLYQIKVYYKSGLSTASGLEEKTSNSDGRVSWTWKVSSNVSPGTYEIIVSGLEHEEHFSYTITE